MRHRLPRLLLTGLLLVTAATAKVTEKFSETHPLAPNGAISLGNINGTVIVEGWDRDEVSIEAEIIARNEDALARAKIVVEHSDDHIAIKTEYAKRFLFLWTSNPPTVRYTLKVPVGAELRRIDVVNGDVRVRGVRGFVDVDTVNGSIEATGLASGGRFDSVNGSIQVSFVRVGPRDQIKLDTVNGSCTATLPHDAAFTLKADSLNGRIRCDFPITLGKSGHRHLKGSVNGGGATVVLDSVNGALAIKKAK
jgi:hypothetical protein